MQDQGGASRGKNFLFIVCYLAGAFIVALRSDLGLIPYICLPPCLVYVTYRNPSKHKILVAFILLASAVLGNYQTRIALIFYSVMAFSAVLIIEKTDHSQFKKLILLILSMILFAMLMFFLSDKLQSGPSFFETLNKTMTEPESIEEINKIMEKNMGENAINFADIDRNELKIALSSFVSIFTFDVIGFLSAVNFWIIAFLMANRNQRIEKPKSFWELSLPKHFVLGVFVLLAVTYTLISVVGNFAYGIVLTLIILLFQLYSLQGIFVLSFFLNKKKMPLILHIPILIALVVLISLTGLGALLIFNLGLIDSIFNVRKLPRGFNGK